MLAQLIIALGVSVLTALAVGVTTGSAVSALLGYCSGGIVTLVLLLLMWR